MGIGSRIKNMRKKTGLTQPELAEKLGVHETTLRRWELEKDRGPDGKSLNTIAKILGTTPEYLLDGENEGKNTAEEAGKKHDNSLVFEWEGNRKLILPNTPETRPLFLELVSQAIGGKNISAPAAV